MILVKQNSEGNIYFSENYFEGEHNMKTLLKNTFIIALVIILNSCSKDDETSPVIGEGTFQITMIDAPAGYEQVNIVIDSVKVHSAINDTISGWTTLSKTKTTYDLLKLVNGANVIIGKAQLPAGQYSQIRLYVGKGSSIVVNGVIYELDTPSGSQSGIKLNVNAKIETGMLYNLTIDFDANKSIVKTGGQNNLSYKLKPVIKVLTTASTGIISGIVEPISSKAYIQGITGTDTTWTATDATGGFKLIYLIPAVYKVTIQSSDTAYRDSIISNISVASGATVNLGNIKLRKK